MDINKVLTMSKNLKNHFRIFAELDEFMREAVALQNVVREFENRKAGLQEEIEALGHEKMDAAEATREFKDKQIKQMDALMQTLNEKLSNREKEVNEAIEEMEARKKNAEEGLTEALRIHAETVESMKEETANLEATRKVAEKGLRDIKTKLG